ncbi:TolB family protein [Micromonospora chersina]|uniref:TolB family protein n=1 Tax=Micromonospora chersina TaxID=47854 RepID=UPI00371902C7
MIRALLIAGFGTLATILLALAGGWLSQTLRLRKRQVVGGVVVCGLLLTLVGAVALLPNDDARDRPEEGSAVPAASLAELAPELLDERILTIDDSADHPSLFASRPDGTARTLVWDMPDSWPAAVVPGTNDFIVSAPWEERSTERLEVFSSQGTFQRALTFPVALESDTSPTYASVTKRVYFIRQSWRDTGNGSRVSPQSRIMEASLDGSSAPRVISTPGFEMRTASVSTDGRTLAGQCVDKKDDSAQVCLISLAKSGAKRLPGNERAAPSEVSISADGRYVAYSSPATNLYGESQVYVYDGRTETTMMVTRLAGFNGHPAWAPKARKPCLAFTHFERPQGASIHITCLSPEPVTVAAAPIGSIPVWLP